METDIFSGLKVVELASVLAGPAVGMFFAELGADVIKIENRKAGGDMTRSWKLPKEDKKKPVSAYFSSVNYNKTYLNKDLKNDVDKNETISLIRECDILICNFKKGSDKKLGLDYDSLSKINEKLIYASIEGFVSDPEKVAFDIVLQAESGFMAMNGHPDKEAAKLPVALIDILAAHHLKEAILIALLKREKTNKGSYVHVSLEEAALASLANQASNFLMERFIPGRMGSLHPNIAPYGEHFTLEDGVNVVLAIGTDKQFEDLCETLNCKELSKGVKYSKNENRVIHREELQKELQTHISRQNGVDFLRTCKKKNIPAGEIKSMDQVLNTPLAKEMTLKEEIEGVLTKRLRSVAFHIESKE